MDWEPIYVERLADLRKPEVARRFAHEEKVLFYGSLFVLEIASKLKNIDRDMADMLAKYIVLEASLKEVYFTDNALMELYSLVEGGDTG